MYYVGKGTECKKEECKPYKTIEGASKAAAKDAELVVWDEDGKIVGGLTDNVPEGATETNEDGSVTAFDGDGNPVGTVDGENVAELTGNDSAEDAQSDENTEGQTDVQGASENAQNEADSSAEEDTDTEEDDSTEEGAETSVIVPHGKMRVTVICDGTLCLRRSAQWGSGNICGRAAKGQSYYVQKIHKVNGKKMVETVGGIFLSGEAEHVEFEQL